MKRYVWIIALFLLGHDVRSQQRDYQQYYPLGDDPNIRYLSSYRDEEKILFEANPTVRYSLYNDVVQGLLNQKHWMQAYYFSFRPQLRMYDDNSKPVRTPSYRILLGTQHMIRDGKKDAFYLISVESGHYSNGQDRGSFTEDYPDGSPEANAAYDAITDATDLSLLLNRTSGNFSTNLTEIILGYRWYWLDANEIPEMMVSPRIGYIRYHNHFLGLLDFGGYTQDDIKLYGRNRFLAGGDFMQVFKHWGGRRLAIRQDFEYIYRPHPSVERFRSETTFTLYPFTKTKAFGFMLGYIYGHDNYNFRFVDSGHQVFAGMTWSLFPPVKMRKID